MSVPQDTRLAHPTRHYQVEPDKVPKGFITSTSTTNAVGNASVSHSANFRFTSTVNKGNTSEKLPSAQQVRGNPTMTDITSLHSIAVPRSNSEDDGDTIPDPQLSTQAALLLAQMSFQNDLDSPEHNIESSEKPQASGSSNVSSPGSKNITPFSRLATPGTRAKAPATAGDQWLSTQCMIDAATPFTFSTEKQKSRRTIPPVEHMTSRKKPKTTNFKLSPYPASASSKPDDRDSNPSPIPLQSPSRETQHSVLPMTLTGTTPPTAQEGRQGLPDPNSFNLSQAIADAGSWLQQSFDLNKDLRQCGISKPDPSSSAGTRRSAVGVDSDQRK
ncbi:hypothetical protein BBP40_003560 [Aspergillus hancockii]|nr:hypothetical protein BBP40_003560 [Aspergillus hancockii]